MVGVAINITLLFSFAQIILPADDAANTLAAPDWVTTMLILLLVVLTGLAQVALLVKIQVMASLLPNVLEL